MVCSEEDEADEPNYHTLTPIQTRAKALKRSETIDFNLDVINQFSCGQSGSKMSSSNVRSKSFRKAKMPPRRRESQVSTTSVAKKGKNEEGAMINQYVIIKTLGKGSFATVLLCKDTHTHELYAIKKMNKKALKSKRAGKDKSAYDCVV